MNIIPITGQTRPHALQEAFRARDCTTDVMRTAIDLWFRLYFQIPVQGEDPCQAIPYTIVNKLTKTVFGEYKATGSGPVQTVLDSLNDKKEEAMQYALAGGCCMLKPMPVQNGWRWDIIRRDNLMVFGKDGRQYTDVGTLQRTVQGEYYYTLLERRTMDGSGRLTIRNRLYRSLAGDELGAPCPLTELPQYAALRPEYTFPEPVGSVGMVQLSTPMVNCVDGSDDPVSVYAAAVGLIRNINRNEAQLSGEFERGESRIIASADVLQKTVEDETGRHTYTLKDKIFVGLDDDLESTGITIFSPALREKSYLARKQEYLRNVESVIGLKRGLISEVEAVDRTATEITSSAGDYNLTIIDFQRMWEKAVRESVQLCSVLGGLYQMGTGEMSPEAVTIDWGNGILYDEEKTRQEMLTQVQSGLLQPERYIGHCYGLAADTETARAKIRREYMPPMDDLTEE